MSIQLPQQSPYPSNPPTGSVYDFVDTDGIRKIKHPDGSIVEVRGSKSNHSAATMLIRDSDNAVESYNLSGELIDGDIPLGDYKHASIGSDVTSIRNEDLGDGVFQNRGLESVTIPDSVTSIGSHAFVDNYLPDVTIPDSVTSIGSSAFEFNSLTSVTIGNSVTSIGNAAFVENSLTSVTIPDSVTSIGNYTFSNNSLTSVTIGNSVTSIGSSAFAYNSLTSVTIPDSVTSIGTWAFRNNSNLETVYTETPASAFDGSDIFLNTDLTTVYVRDNDGQLATYPSSPTSWKGASNVSFVEWTSYPDPMP